MANVTLSVPILLEAARVAASVSDSDFKNQIAHTVSEAFDVFVDDDDSDFETASESDLDSDDDSDDSQDSDGSFDSSVSTTPHSPSLVSSPITPPEHSIPPLPYLPGAAEKQHPPVLTTRAFETLSIERRMQARAKLHAVISSQKPWRPPLGQLASAASAVANANASKPDEDEDNTADVPSIEVKTKPIVADEATIKKRTKQIGTLALITAASGWDIKLRELVMREAKIGDPERIAVRHVVAIEEIPSTPVKTAPYGVDVNAPIIARASANNIAESDSLTVPGLSYVRRSSVFSSTPNAPGMARTPSIPTSDAEPMFPPVRRSSVFSTSANAPNPVLRERKSASNLSSSLSVTGDFPSAAPAAEYDDNEMDLSQQQLSVYLQQRRKTEFATIVSGYDERLREIVLEAEKTQQNHTRQRGRYNVFSDEDVDFADTESDSDQNQVPHKHHVSTNYSFPPTNSEGKKLNVSTNYTFPPINTVSLPPIIPNPSSPTAAHVSSQNQTHINTSQLSPPKKTPILVPLNDSSEDRTNRRGHSLNVSLLESQTAISRASKSRSRSRHGVRLVPTSLDIEGFSRERRRSSTLNPDEFPHDRRRSSTMNPEDFPRERRKSKAGNPEELPFERRKSKSTRSDSRGDIIRARSSSRTRPFPTVAIEERDEEEQPDEQSHASSVSETEVIRGRSATSKVSSDEERGRRIKKMPVSQVATKLKMELSRNRETARPPVLTAVDMSRSISSTSTLSATSTSSTTIKRRSFIPNLGVLDAIKRSNMSPDLDESKTLPYFHSSTTPVESSDAILAASTTASATVTTARTTMIPNLGVLDAIKKTVLTPQDSASIDMPIADQSVSPRSSLIPNLGVLDTIKILGGLDSQAPDSATENAMSRPPIIPNLGMMDALKTLNRTTPTSDKHIIVDTTLEPESLKIVAKKSSLESTEQVTVASGKSMSTASVKSGLPVSNGRYMSSETTQNTATGTKLPTRTVKKAATPMPPKSSVAKSLKEHLEKKRMSEMGK
ncbi:hypothetical protein HK096_002796 [Nowakowskiella sp. JEL0078]|nr:hypothetical protein HK096_002796 [Nowakowskiella sp. JEL0078]